MIWARGAKSWIEMGMTYELFIPVTVPSIFNPLESSNGANMAAMSRGILCVNRN